MKHKAGHLVGVHKYIKQLVTKDCELEYVALMKTVKEEELVVITNGVMEVEGMSHFIF